MLVKNLKFKATYFFLVMYVLLGSTFVCLCRCDCHRREIETVVDEVTQNSENIIYPFSKFFYIIGHQTFLEQRYGNEMFQQDRFTQLSHKKKNNPKKMYSPENKKYKKRFKIGAKISRSLICVLFALRKTLENFGIEVSADEG